MVPFRGSFWIKVGFSFVIHSSILAFSWELINQISSQSLKDMNFVNDHPCMLSWPSVFQFRTFLSVALTDSRCIFVSKPSSSHCNFFQCYLSIQPFCFVLSVPKFLSKISLLPLHKVVCVSSGFFHSLVGRIFFSLFWKVSFRLYCLILSRYRLYFFSTISFDLSRQLTLSCLPFCFSLLSPTYPFCVFSSITFLLVVVVYVSVLLAYFPSNLFISVRVPLENIDFYLKLVLLRHKFARLVQWCYPLRYLVIICLSF